MKTYWTDAAWELYDPDADRNNGRCGYEAYFNESCNKELNLTEDERADFEGTVEAKLDSDTLSDATLERMIFTAGAKER